VTITSANDVGDDLEEQDAARVRLVRQNDCSSQGLV
jgi:hypothetical protein